MSTNDAVILSAVRTPTGKFLGALKSLSAPELGALAVREAVSRAGLLPADVDECILGNVLAAGLGQAPARQAGLGAGIPRDHWARSRSTRSAGPGVDGGDTRGTGRLPLGDADVVAAGGMESMSNAPYAAGADPGGPADGQRRGPST